MTNLSTNVSKLDSSMPGYSMYSAQCTCDSPHHEQRITVEYDAESDWTDICIHHKAHTKELVSYDNYFKRIYYQSTNPVVTWLANFGWNVTDKLVRVKYAFKILWSGYIELEHFYTMRSAEHHNSYIAAIQDGLKEATRNRLEVLASKAKVNK